MVSDMVWRGSFHRHIMTSGGRTARPARTAQPSSERRLPARPAVQTAETQSAVTVALMESSCILKVYGPARHNAVPECTPKPQDQRNKVLRTTSGRAGLAAALCNREQRRAGSVRYSLWNGGAAAMSRTICC
jgi:hypothetical protein